jgi:cytochrome c oxidase subunit 2
VAVAPTLTAAQVLFRDKGCVTCHVHRGVPGPSGVVHVGAPDLSNYRNDPAFLRRWLDDPAALRPGTRMPELPLSEAEIGLLVEFLGVERD